MAILVRSGADRSGCALLLFLQDHTCIRTVQSSTMAKLDDWYIIMCSNGIITNGQPPMVQTVIPG